MRTSILPPPNALYPESDGQPMAENTLQFRWIVVIKENLEILLRHEPLVFIAGDLLWYPVQGQPTIRRAPDAMVVFGRPRGERRAYLQWEEANIAPQIVFEILSQSNTTSEMDAKLDFYNTYGVAEYYVYDPQTNELSGYLRDTPNDDLREIAVMDDWRSPLLGISFDLSGPELQVRYPDGTPFLTPLELAERAERAEAEVAAQRQRAASEEQRATSEQRRAERAEQLASEQRQRAAAERERAAQAEQRAAQAEQRATAERERAAQAEQAAQSERERAAQAEQRAAQAEQRAAALEAQLRALGRDPAMLDGEA